MFVPVRVTSIAQVPRKEKANISTSPQKGHTGRACVAGVAFL